MFDKNTLKSILLIKDTIKLRQAADWEKTADPECSKMPTYY